MKTNKKVMLSIALLMVNSVAFASEDLKNKSKNAASKAAQYIPTVDGAKQVVVNLASSAVQAVKNHPIVTGAIIGAALLSTQTGRDAVTSAVTALYNRMPANPLRRDAATSDHVQLPIQKEKIKFVKKEFFAVRHPDIKSDFLSLNLSDELVKKAIMSMFEEVLDRVGNDDFNLKISGRSGFFCIIIMTYEPKDTPLINDEGCKFCVQEYKGQVLNETNDAIAFEKSTPPRNPIDFLITPKVHVVNYKDPSFTPDMFINQLAMAQEFAKNLNDSGDVILSVNNGKGAGQTVFHSHMHFKSKSSWKE